MHVNQLIVLGNGFDLQCGLKSRFADFFEVESLPKLREIPRFDMIENPDVYASTKDRLTFWDLILAFDRDSNWCDIETKIKDWVTDPELIVEPYHYQRRLETKFKCKEERSDDAKELGALDPSIISDFVRLINNDWGDAVRNAEFLDFLMRELHLMERQFAQYLKVETQDKAYRKNCLKFFQRILDDGLAPLKNTVSENSVLDFNYTTPCWSKNDQPDNCKIVNIHGSISDADENEIIFGINGDGHLKESLIAPFTKTYRLLSMCREPKKELSRALVNAAEDGGATIVKVYGHSLASEDDAYFQAIFDALDIYQGETEFVFYYAPDREGEHVKKTKAVTRLLNKYGSTLDNQDHGKNLMHKLLIEGRLSVRPLGLENHQADPD